MFDFLLENTNMEQSMEIPSSLMAACKHANGSSNHSEKL
jgi:hypothetical protein